MEDGNPRSNEVSKTETLTEEMILHLLDVATDYKIRRETEADAAADAAEGGDEEHTPEAPGNGGAEDGNTDVPDTIRILSDLLTIQEHFGYLREIAFRCIGAEEDAMTGVWQGVCEKMGMEWLSRDDLPEMPEDVREQDATAVAMETDADEQQLFLYRLPADHLTTEAVTYAIAHAADREEAADEA